MSDQTRLVRLLSVSMALALLGGSSVQAARLLEIRIERNGQAILKGMTEDNSQADPGIVWEYLNGELLKAENGLTPDPADPMRATLTGKIRVAVLHTGQPAAVKGSMRTDVVVDELRLVRPSPDSEYWVLAPGEVERSGRIGGITRSQPQWWPLAIGSAAGIGLVVLVFRMATRRSRTKSNGASAEPPR